MTLVYWSKLSVSVVKLNFDGSTLSNPRKIEAGGVTRDQNGDLIYTYATPLGHGTNNQIEWEIVIWGSILVSK